jgi:uncharacterized protein YycO
VGNRYLIARVTGALALSAAIVATPGGAAWAAPADDAFTRLLRLNPGVSSGDMRNSLRAAAAANGLSYEKAVATALAEAERHSAASNASIRNSSGSVGAAGTGSNSCKSVAIGSARYKGDVFYAPSITATINHGHAGIYATTTSIVEAPGSGYKSGRFAASARTYCQYIEKMDIATSVATQGKAADYAAENLVGKSYNNNFAANKGSGTDSLNCSELVWKAYKRSVNLDLDGDGGLGVYPLDIRNSALTRTYATVK